MSTAGELPPFPVDDFTLDQLEHALNTCRGDNGELVGGDFTLSQFLDFMSGRDPQRVTLVGYADDVPIYEGWDQQYSEHDVIRALVLEVRRLRALGRGVAQETQQTLKGTSNE